ncbi:hypothetical protein [Arthrobacter sp. NPDC090010]|uniref:hypothetical protein n=1 Tax=Arthrobacter sp. NPDC090010 TaxID=3363942 RepID=UPI0037F87E2B
MTQGQRTLTLSAPAWRLAVHHASSSDDRSEPIEQRLGMREATALAALPLDVRNRLDTELREAGILDSAGELTTDWLRALRAAIEAPIKANLISTGDGIRTHCELALFDGLGLSVDASQPVPSNDGAALPGSTPVVVTLFTGEEAWEVVERTLPPFPELTSTESGGARELGRREIGEDAMEALEQSARATVQFSLTAPGYQALHLWLLDEHLEEARVRRTGDGEQPATVLIRHQPGAIARQFVWDVLGGYQAVDHLAGDESEVSR